LFPLMSRLANSVLGKDLVLAIFSPEGLWKNIFVVEIEPKEWF
jgi:hypothetical protein